MSLLDESSHTFVIMEKTRGPDGESGSTTVWASGLEFKAAMRSDSSMLAQIAEQQGDVSNYTLLYPKTINLVEGDYVKRKSDMKPFRITSNPTDKATPAVSRLNLRSVKMESVRGGMPT